eukprot:CAMPEP_0168392976 /NCGR_PEP_ID=MMETSP0228-20121227/18777_1 /TAXON_ID=133427 /ORGANISM="Protoceratium reticulatum, Strain CCCM 535 (=CCMP 1889)" /LENGTH=898 /DNA_ID=CAMNT_0008406337 /DNA_START=72 /DNA_END=2771 /DNA_ORIENTATION=-
MGDDGESLAVLPRSMGQTAPGSQHKRKDPRTFIPQEKGGLLLTNPNEEENPYSFSDSPAYLAKKKFEEQSKRAAELESKDETRGFLRSVEELGKKHKWEEAFQLLERRTAVPSGLFLVTRAVLRWKFCRYSGALRDVEEALKSHGSSVKAGPLAAALSCFARLCLGSELRDQGSCSREMRELATAWAAAEERTLRDHALGQGLFHPREVPRLPEPQRVVEHMEAHDGSYVAATGVRIGYVFLRNLKDSSAPLLVHFHGTSETAADYRTPALAQKYCDLPVHLLVVDYRGYGWSADKPSLATFLRDAEPLAEKLPEIAVQHGLAWPYPSGLILSGRSLGAQVAVHLAAMYPALFRGLILDSAVATSATGDRLGRAPERTAALQCWRRELEKASLEVLLPLESEFWCLSVLEKVRAYNGQVLLLHGLADETVPYEGSESLHGAVGTQRKELVLIEHAGHNNIGHFDAYWSAQRRFALKIQLEDSVPKVGEQVEHLCAICAEKAVSKCGRCQKVWYCSRQHQAEHWRDHKLTCAGGPPEPKPKVEPEGEACLVAACAAEVEDEAELAALSRSLASAATQGLQICLSWHAVAGLAEQLEHALEELRAGHQGLQLSAVRSQEPLPGLGHCRALAAAVAQDAPAHAWVAFLDQRGLWSPRYGAVLLPALRRAAADARAIAVSCPRRARAKDDAVVMNSSAEVEAALEGDKLELCDQEEAFPLHLWDLAVRAKTLSALVDSTPAPVLGLNLCAHRFRSRLRSTFGKRVEPLAAPAGEWLRWAPAPAPAGPGAVDLAAARELVEGLRSAGGEGAAETAEAPRLDAAAVAEALAGLRLAIERRLVERAGERLARKELRTLAVEHMADFLDRAGLAGVIGLQRWAKETATGIAEGAAQRFAVELVDAP